MRKKIKIDKSGVIVFMGSMNAMPMMYAWELRRRGYDVLYFVDAPPTDALSRPENHYAGLGYPYPNWVVELKMPTQMMLPYFSRLHAKRVMKNIRSRTKKAISCFFLNGFFVSLAPWLKTEGKVVALSHGSDLDVWANRGNAKNLSNSFKNRSIFNFLPSAFAGRLIEKAVKQQYAGFSSSDAVIYFPHGFNISGDEVVGQLRAEGKSVWERYDVSFEPLAGVSREIKEPESKIILFSGVRFLYKTFPDGNREYSKGNDIMIQGIAEYWKRNKRIEVHFVEKGEDVLHAKQLCRDLGINEIVVWHKEMPFNKLIDLYLKSDICFDQVGAHWMGAIGAYALFLGRPLIANVNKAMELGVFPYKNPILSAENASDVFDALVKLENDSFRRNLSQDSKIFVEREMGCSKLIDSLFSLT
ncbi:hypothetical protein [Variovorax sp. UMC13]|uniref:hypothetical protein n=1 Tax=Variovorax sp. UMC13 TaxID=1862326 RepID=UPI0015FF7842|nr:hypothetical protein [Variovorax sp. UMC13]